MTTTFIKRDAPKDGEVTVHIHQDADAILGHVSAPGGVEGTHTAAAHDHDGALGVHQALASAIEIAAKHGNTVGIVDEQNLWREEWGDLVEDDG